MDKGRKNLLVASIAGGSVVAAAAAFYAVFWSRDWFHIVSDFFPPVLSLIGVLLAYGIFRRQRKDRIQARIWLGMVLGLALWTAGELIWAYYDLPGLEEIPYPSAADALWLAGYVPFYFMLAYQYALLRASVPRGGKIMIVVVLLAISVAAFLFDIRPILADPQAGTPVELALTLLYPVCDLILMALAFMVCSVFMGGRLALSWVVIAAGILVNAFSDLLFGYFTWNGLYYPEGRLNLLSAVFDIVYIFAYVAWDTGLYLRYRLPETEKDVDLRKYMAEEGKDFLLMTDQDGRTVYIDPPLVPILGLRKRADALGKSFGQLLGLSGGYEGIAIRKASRTGLSDDFTVLLGLSRAKYRVRVVTSSDPEKLPGFDIIVHPDSGMAGPERDRGTSMVGWIASRALGQGGHHSPFGGEGRIRAYVDTLVDLMYILTARAGGAGTGSAFESVLNESARRMACPFEIRNGHSAWKDAAAEPDAYRRLLDEAVGYTLNVVSADTLGSLFGEIEKYVDSETVREADALRLRGIQRLDGQTG
jgi:hypothetical protein